jgi:hypothetical protein
MWDWLRKTARRGRSFVPRIFLRIRPWIRRLMLDLVFAFIGKPRMVRVRG